MSLGEALILLAILSVAALVRWFLPTYLAEKGKNLATGSLRPVFDHVLGEGESEASRRQKRLSDFSEAFNGFTRTVWKRKPFYPHEVFKELEELIRIAHSEAIGYQMRRPEEHQQY